MGARREDDGPAAADPLRINAADIACCSGL
jgi:hypothetical protein